VKSGAAVDAAGNPNTASTSTDNSVVFVNENPDISEAKQRADRSTVAFSSKIVTGIYTAGFYIEDADRSAGILVKPSVMPSGLAVGANTCVYGTIRTLSTGERYIDGQASVL
jgi:hypothetical protein